MKSCSGKKFLHEKLRQLLLLAAFSPVDFTQKKIKITTFFAATFREATFAEQLFHSKTVTFRKQSTNFMKKSVSDLQPSRAEAKLEGVCFFYQKINQKTCFEQFSMKTTCFWTVFNEKTFNYRRFGTPGWQPVDLVLLLVLGNITNPVDFTQKKKKNQNHYFFCSNFSWTNFLSNNFFIQRQSICKKSQFLDKFHEKSQFQACNRHERRRSRRETVFFKKKSTEKTYI